jgi:chemotaxis signal transduction protein
VPGCPAYVPGLVNCHGKPYTVIDLRVLFENERQTADQFLVLNLEDDDVVVGCTEVEEIIEVDHAALSSFAANDAAGRFCSAMLEHGDRRIPVLAIAQILKELEHDLA